MSVTAVKVFDSVPILLLLCY